MHGTISSFAQRQAAFASAVLDPGKPVPAGLVGPDGLPSARRFAVYRNNVVVGLIETLKAAFPATSRLVGDEFFSAMARFYVMREPPASPIMLDYGASFPAFIGGFEPAGGVPYLEDVARLERAWVEAYHAAEALPLDPALLSRIKPEDMASVCLDLHPSVRIVRSAFPVVAIWQVNVGEGDAAGIQLDGGHDALVARPDSEVAVRSLPIGAAVFLQSLQSGAAIINAMKAALSDSPGFDLSRALAGIMEARIITGFRISPANQAVAS